MLTIITEEGEVLINPEHMYIDSFEPFAGQGDKYVVVADFDAGAESDAVARGETSEEMEKTLEWIITQIKCGITVVDVRERSKEKS